MRGATHISRQPTQLSRISWLIFGSLAATSVVLLAMGLLGAEGSLAHSMYEWHALPEICLLLLLLREADAIRRELDLTAQQAYTAKSELDPLLDDSREVRSELTRLSRQVATVRDEIRKSDSLLHGKLYFHQEQYVQALDLFRESVSANPDNYIARGWLGLTMVQLGQYDEARDHLIAATEVDEEERTLRGLATTQDQLRDYDGALRTLSRVLALKLTRTTRVAVLGSIANIESKRSGDRAKTALRDLVSKSDYSAVPVERLSEVLATDQEYAEAIELCDEAIRQNPRNWNVYATRGGLLLLRDQPGDREPGLRDLQSARTGNPREHRAFESEAKYWIAKAVAEPSIDVRKGLFERAMPILRDGLQNVVGSKYRHRMYLQLAFVRLALNDPDGAEEAAMRADRAQPLRVGPLVMLCQIKNSQLRWMSLLVAADALKTTGGATGRVYAHAYRIVGLLASGEPASTAHEDLRRLVAELIAIPAFKPVHPEWSAITVRPDVLSLSPEKRRVLEAIFDFLAGTDDHLMLADHLRPFVPGLPPHQGAEIRADSGDPNTPRIEG